MARVGGGSGGAGLCCGTDISMMEATDFAKRHDPARLWPGLTSGASLSSERWVRAP